MTDENEIQSKTVDGVSVTFRISGVESFSADAHEMGFRLIVNFFMGSSLVFSGGEAKVVLSQIRDFLGSLPPPIQKQEKA